MTILAVGVNTKHDKDFVIDNPGNRAAFIFLHAVSHAVVGTAQGRVEMTPGSCIIHTPGFPRYLATRQQDAVGFQNNWIVFDGPDVVSLLARYQIPVNTLLAGQDIRELTRLIHELYFEKRYSQPFCERKSELLLEELLIIAHRGQKKLRRAGVAVKARTAQAFHAVRDHLYLRPESVLSVADMAREARLTPTHFTHVYKKLFFVTPGQDMARARIEKAKLLLLYEDNELADIAEQCGFQNEYYFSTAFKRVTGSPPGLYRNMRRTEAFPV